MVLRDPDRVLFSTLAGKVLIGIGRMKEKIKRPLHPLTNKHNNNNSPGDNSVTIGPEGGDVVKVATFVSLSPNNTSNINDNYCVSPNLCLLDSVTNKKVVCAKGPVISKTVISQTVNQTVSYNVVSHVPFAYLQEPPQKKGVSPAQLGNEIKHVKGVCCVNPCLKSLSGVCFETGLHPPIQTKTPVDKISHCTKWLCQPGKESLSKRGPGQSHEKVGSRKGGDKVIPGLLQPPVSGPQTEPKMEANFRSEPTESLSQFQHLQNGNPGDNKVILTERGVGHIARLQRRVFPRPYHPKVQKISRVLPVQSDLLVHSPSLRSGHGSSGVNQSGQGSKTYGPSKGYLNPPIPKRSVAESPEPGNLPTTYPDPLGPLPTARVDCKLEKIRTYPETSFQFCRLLVRPVDRLGPSHPGPVVNSSRETETHNGLGELHSQTVHVSDKPPHCNGKTSLVWLTSHATHSVASEEALACTRRLREGQSTSTISSPSPRLVVG